MKSTRTAFVAAFAGALLVAACGEGGGGGGAGGGGGVKASGGILVVTEDTLIPIEDFTSRFGWDESNDFWRWDRSIASGVSVSGRVILMGQAALDRGNAITFSFGSNNQAFGRTCVGNISIEGLATFKAEGLLLHENSTLRFPGGPEENPCGGTTINANGE